MSTTELKLIALVLMLLDHVGLFIPDAPFFLRMIGRLSAPLFLFCAAEGFRHTTSRRRYLLRLYLCSIGMAALDFALNTAYPSTRVPLTNNIFVTILLGCLLTALIEQLGDDPKRAALSIAAFVLMQFVGDHLCRAAEGLVPHGAGYAAALLPNLHNCEGGLFFALLTVMFSLFGTQKHTLTLGFCAMSGYALCAAWSFAASFNGSPPAYLFGEGCQWMMIGALPLLLLYNGERGRNPKLLFYLFYPLHCAALFLIAQHLS